MNAFFMQGIPAGCHYMSGWYDGVEDGLSTLLGDVIGNQPFNNVMRGISGFVEAVRSIVAEKIVSAAVGFEKGRPVVWLFVPDIDVALTVSIHQVQSAIEDASQTAFEVFVKPTQGRPVEALVPSDFALVK
jgi:hypothetical protein